MRIYINDGFHPDAVEWLKSVAEVVYDLNEPDTLDGILIRRGGVDRALMEKAKNLKVIGRHGAGYDTVDIAAAKELGIRVINVPHGNTNSVAEMIVALFLTMSRKVNMANTMLRRGEVKHIAPIELMGHELTGCTLGLIGVGNIACRAAEILKAAFNVEVYGYSRNFTPMKAAALGIKYSASLEELLEKSDLVNISVPYSDSTKNMISGEIFDHFKRNAVFVNTSRGGIVNEDDLYEALKANKLGAAAFDVFKDEPIKPDNKLLALDNFSATPHIAGTTEEAVRRTSMSLCENAVKVILGESAEGVVV